MAFVFIAESAVLEVFPLAQGRIAQFSRQYFESRGPKQPSHSTSLAVILPQLGGHLSAMLSRAMESFFMVA